MSYFPFINFITIFYWLVKNSENNWVCCVPKKRYFFKVILTIRTYGLIMIYWEEKVLRKTLLFFLLSYCFMLCYSFQNNTLTLTWVCGNKIPGPLFFLCDFIVSFHFEIPNIFNHEFKSFTMISSLVSWALQCLICLWLHHLILTQLDKGGPTSRDKYIIEKNHKCCSSTNTHYIAKHKIRSVKDILEYKYTWGPRQIVL